VLGSRARKECSRQLAQRRLNELMGLVATHYFVKQDLVSAAIYAMALRQLSPEVISGPEYAHDPHLHNELNKLFGVEDKHYLYEACDSLLDIVKKELARHGIIDPPPHGKDPARA
jgi:hypothetical protein